MTKTYGISIDKDYKPLYWNDNGKYQQEFDELTKELVPPSGAGQTLNAELIRGANRLYYEYFNNGNGNAVEYEKDYEDDEWQGNPYMTEYYGKFVDLFNEFDILADVKGFENAMLNCDVLCVNEVYYWYDQMIDAVYEYVTTHEDEELPSWYDAN